MRIAWCNFQNTHLGTILRVSDSHATPGGQATTHHARVSNIVQARYASHGCDDSDGLCLSTCTATNINRYRIFAGVCLETF